MTRPIETADGSAAMRIAAVRAERRPDDPGVLERGHDLLEELGRQPVALGERRPARSGPSPSCRTRSTRARRPYSERRERRIARIVVAECLVG